eukprot:TRINITY_DN14645_c0_g1_i1.p1 TRINITY_DN14645_c0_g1~~TRINITY_DN14645_c0_g1_i1.p1  ORF type:complete len:1121 (+),score=317.63 TRINITY_DN14645_c0_g1_i1:83-3364(+)
MASNELAQLVQAISNQDNNVRGQAEAQISQLAVNRPDDLIGGLLGLMVQWPDQTVQTLSGVLLRTYVAMRDCPWSESKKQPQWKANLIEIIQAPAVPIFVKDRAIDIIGKIALVEYLSSAEDDVSQANVWPELALWLFQFCSSPDATNRLCSLKIFSQVLPFIPKLMSDVNALRQLFLQCMDASQTLEVRAEASKAACRSMASCSREQARTFDDCLGMIIQTLGGLLTAGEEDQVADIVEALLEVVETQPSCLRTHIVLLCSAMTQIMKNADLEDRLTQLALEMLITIAEKRPGMLKQHVPTFVQDVLPHVLNLMLQLEENPNWNLGPDKDLEDEEHAIGQESLDRLAVALGHKELIPVLFAAMTTLLGNNEVWQQRYVGLAAISLVGEGCRKFLKSRLNEVLAAVIPRMGDSHPRVRWAACNAIGQIAEDFGAKYFQHRYHAQVIPPLIAVMDDAANPRVQAHAASAIVNYCRETKKSSLEPYLEPLLAKLAILLQTNIILVQEQAVAAVAAVAECVAEDFFKYYDQFMPFLTQVLTQATGKDHRTLRGRAMECISLIGIAVGKDRFLADAKPVMEILLQMQATIEIDDPINGFLPQALARISKALGPEFAPYLQRVLPVVLKTAARPTSAEWHNEDKLPSHISESEDWNCINVGGKTLAINTTELEEKCTACNMLYCYALDNKDAFFPFVEPVWALMMKNLTYTYSEGIRMYAASTLPQLLLCSNLYFEKNSPQNIHKVQALWLHMFGALRDAILEELEPTVTTDQLEALYECIDLMPNNSLDQNHLTELCNLLAEVMKQVMDRRTEREADQDEDFDPDQVLPEGELDQEVAMGIAEVIGKTVKKHPTTFFPVYQATLQGYFHALLRSPIETDLHLSLCVYSDLAEFAGQLIQPDMPNFLPAMLKAMTHEEAYVRQAAVYGIGASAVAGGDYFMQHLANVTQGLMALVTHPDARATEDNGNATDNAISALGKIFLTHGDRPEINIAQTLPTWLTLLPCTHDTIEALVVHEQFALLMQQRTQILLGENYTSLPRVLVLCGAIIGTDVATAETNAKLINMLKQMQSGLPGEVMGAAFNALDDTQKARIQRACA